MSKGWKPKIIKQNGIVQRGGVLLSKEIASALVQRVLLGETLYPSEGKLELLISEGEEKKLLILSCNTLNTWIKRGNIIPETGCELRAVLDKAREDYRTRKKAKIDKKREKIIDRKFNRVISMQTKEPVIGAFGVLKDKDGNVIKKENVKLLKIQMDNVKFLAERLYPNRYGKIGKTESKRPMFSLADLRKYKEEKMGGKNR